MTPQQVVAQASADKKAKAEKRAKMIKKFRDSWDKFTVCVNADHNAGQRVRGDDRQDRFTKHKAYRCADDYTDNDLFQIMTDDRLNVAPVTEFPNESEKTESMTIAQLVKKGTALGKNVTEDTLRYDLVDAVNQGLKMKLKDTAAGDDGNGNGESELADLSIKKLKAYAKKNKIKLTGAKTKQEILDKIAEDQEGDDEDGGNVNE